LIYSCWQITDSSTRRVLCSMVGSLKQQEYPSGGENSKLFLLAVLIPRTSN
jgi:hypothetical protein